MTDAKGWPDTFSSDDVGGDIFAAIDARSAGMTYAQFLKTVKAPTPAAKAAATPAGATTPAISEVDAEIESYGLPRLTSGEARNPDSLEAWNETYLDTKDQLNYIITSGKYPKASVVKAQTKLAEIEKTYVTGETTAYKTFGKTKADKDVPQLGQLINYARSQNPPSTEDVLQSNIDAMKGVLGEAVSLELQYGPQLADVEFRPVGEAHMPVRRVGRRATPDDRDRHPQGTDPSEVNREAA